MKKIIYSNSPEETKEIGRKLGVLAKANMVYALLGDLGAGKTLLTKGIAKGLNISKTISSPTFTILKIYYGDLTLYHFDAYRLEGINQDLGFEEMIDGEGLTVIEWPQYISDLIKDEYLEINISVLDDESRKLEFIAHGDIYEKILGELA